MKAAAPCEPFVCQAAVDLDVRWVIVWLAPRVDLWMSRYGRGRPATGHPRQLILKWARWHALTGVPWASLTGHRSWKPGRKTCAGDSGEAERAVFAAAVNVCPASALRISFGPSGSLESRTTTTRCGSPVVLAAAQSAEHSARVQHLVASPGEVAARHPAAGLDRRYERRTVRDLGGKLILRQPAPVRASFSSPAKTPSTASSLSGLPPTALTPRTSRTPRTPRTHALRLSGGPERGGWRGTSLVRLTSDP